MGFHSVDAMKPNSRYAAFFFTTLAVACMAAWSLPTARFLSAPDGYDDKDGTLTNMCECECCYDIELGRVECMSSSAMMFEVRKCSQCDVHSCEARFRAVCANSSVRKAVCVERRAWFLKLLPSIFIFTTLGLIVYGCCFRTTPPRMPYYEVPPPGSVSSPRGIPVQSSIQVLNSEKPQSRRPPQPRNLGRPISGIPSPLQSSFSED